MTDTIGPRAGRVQIMRSSRQARQHQDTDFTHGIHLERGKLEVENDWSRKVKQELEGPSMLPCRTLRTYKRRFKRSQ